LENLKESSYTGDFENWTNGDGDGISPSEEAPGRGLRVGALSLRTQCRKCDAQRNPQSTFVVSVIPDPHSDIHTWVNFFLDLKDIRKLIIGAI
jgi:hypothetical protein